MYVGKSREHLHEETLGMAFRNVASLRIDEVEELAIAEQLRREVVSLHQFSILLKSYSHFCA